MEFYRDTTQTWKLSKIKELLTNESLAVPEWQRLEKRKKKEKGPEDLVKAILTESLHVSWSFSDLKSDLNYAIFTGNKEDEKYFTSLLKYTIENELTGFKESIERLYTIEDGLQRVSNLNEVEDHHFKNEEEKIKFWNSTVPVYLFYNCSILKLVEIFTITNNGFTLTTEEKLWGYPSPINIELKVLIIKSDWVNRLYAKKATNESVRDIYKNIKKILIICGYNDGLISMNGTTSISIKSFTQNLNDTIKNYDKIIREFQLGIIYLEEHFKRKKHQFSFQAKMSFIIHIMNKENIKLNTDDIIYIMNHFSDTRKNAGYWYKEIERFIIENYG